VICIGSDGRRGYVARSGTIDQCRTEIIDLLEGGREAFDLCPGISASCLGTRSSKRRSG